MKGLSATPRLEFGPPTPTETLLQACTEVKGGSREGAGTPAQAAPNFLQPSCQRREATVSPGPALRLRRRALPIPSPQPTLALL